MSWRHFIGLVVVALSMALTKALLSSPREEPAPAPAAGAVNYDSLYPEAADAALKARAAAKP